MDSSNSNTFKTEFGTDATTSYISLIAGFNHFWYVGGQIYVKKESTTEYPMMPMIAKFGEDNQYLDHQYFDPNMYLMDGEEKHMLLEDLRGMPSH